MPCRDGPAKPKDRDPNRFTFIKRPLVGRFLSGTIGLKQRLAAAVRLSIKHLLAVHVIEPNGNPIGMGLPGPGAYGTIIFSTFDGAHNRAERRAMLAWAIKLLFDSAPDRAESRALLAWAMPRRSSG